MHSKEIKNLLIIPVSDAHSVHSTECYCLAKGFPKLQNCKVYDDYKGGVPSNTLSTAWPMRKLREYTTMHFHDEIL